MSATSIAVPATRPASSQASMAASFPRDLSHSPLLGIFGVVLGAGIVTLTGRLITLGLPDLKGNVGISFDDGAWISTIWNTALIFIGPLSVYIGGLLGPRRVLLAGAGAFTLLCAYLPLVHSYSLLITLLALAGLTSGTFYPLTLTFALRNIPLRYLALVVAFYVTSIEGAMNLAPSMYGFCRDHLTWEWMFWIPALLTPVMMLSIYYGIPRSPKAQSKKSPPSFAAFLYASTGLGLLFAALDQGQRLDWWRSGLFTSLFVGGVFFVLCSLIRRRRGPNFLVDLPYLRKRNTLLLGFALFFFRFVLLATLVIIPQSLAVRGLDAGEYASAVLWSGVFEFILAFVGAFFLYRGIDSRLLMAMGFAAIAYACLINANYTSAWAAENYFRTEFLMAIGQSFAMLGLVSSIILQGVSAGAFDAPQRALTFSAFFHVIRLFGGQTGAVLMGHYIAEQEKVHSFLLGLHVQSGQWITDSTVRHLAAGLAAKSSGPMAATGRALDIVNAKLRLQAYSLTFIDAFHFVAWFCAVMLLVTVFLRKAPMNFRQLGRLQDAKE